MFRDDRDPQQRPKNRNRALALAVVTSLAIAGCSDHKDSTASTAATTNTSPSSERGTIPLESLPIRNISEVHEIDLSSEEGNTVGQKIVLDETNVDANGFYAHVTFSKTQFVDGVAALGILIKSTPDGAKAVSAYYDLETGAFSLVGNDTTLLTGEPHLMSMSPDAHGETGVFVAFETGAVIVTTNIIE